MKKSDKSSIWMLVTLCGTFLLSACSFTYKPNIGLYKFEPIHEFKSSNTVTIMNTEKNTGDAVFYTNAGREWSSNKHEWAEAVVKITERELTLRGMKVQENADRKLEINVDSYKVTSGGWGFHGYIYINVKTGDGYQKRYTGDGGANRVEYSMDIAMMKAVVAMLRDPLIVKYLTK